jgi:hypothetical protein
VEPEVKEDGTPTGYYLVTAGEGGRLAMLLRAKRKQIRKSEPVRCWLDPYRQHSLGVANADAGCRQIVLDQSTVEERRQRPCFEHHAKKPACVTAKRLRDHLGIRRARTAPPDRTIAIHNANMRCPVTHISYPANIVIGHPPACGACLAPY